MSTLNFSLFYYEDGVTERVDEPKDANMVTCSKATGKDNLAMFAEILKFKGEIQESKSGKAWVVYKEEPEAPDGYKVDASSLKKKYDAIVDDNIPF
jgi:hypothetical protein